jgi:Na+-translocating ferredoxin:NAD+ oxidoreductase RnfE subunit
MLSSKTFTSYQVLEIFVSIFVGACLIYGGMQLHKDQDLIKKHAPEEAQEPFNNTLGWIFIVMGAGIILLGLYRLFMRGTSVV